MLWHNYIFIYFTGVISDYRKVHVHGQKVKHDNLNLSIITIVSVAG